MGGMMSNQTSKEKADRLRQLADLVDDMPHAVAWEVQRALREHADLVERPSEATGALTTLQKERNYKTHKTRMSDASSFDEICTECGATDFPGSDLLDLPCPKAAPPHEPQGWQPIETAPHMRKIIVHYLNALGKSRTVMACYYEKNSLEMHDDYEDVGTYDDATGMTWSDEGWYEEHDSENPIMALAGTPTHWMPLPSAPVTKLRLPFGMSVPAPGTKCDHGVLLEDECEACNSSTKSGEA